MADTVTHYVAERMIERERALEGDWLIKRVARDEKDRRKAALQVANPATTNINANLGWIIAALLLGVIIGIVGLLGSAWFSLM